MKVEQVFSMRSLGMPQAAKNCFSNLRFSKFPFLTIPFGKESPHPQTPRERGLDTFRTPPAETRLEKAGDGPVRE